MEIYIKIEYVSLKSIYYCLYLLLFLAYFRFDRENWKQNQLKIVEKVHSLALFYFVVYFKSISCNILTISFLLTKVHWDLPHLSQPQPYVFLPFLSQKNKKKGRKKAKRKSKERKERKKKTRTLEQDIPLVLVNKSWEWGLSQSLIHIPSITLCYVFKKLDLTCGESITVSCLTSDILMYSNLIPRIASFLLFPISQIT